MYICIALGKTTRPKPVTISSIHAGKFVAATRPDPKGLVGMVNNQKAVVFTDILGNGYPVSVSLWENYYPPRANEPVAVFSICYEVVSDREGPLTYWAMLKCSEVTFKRYSQACRVEETIDGKPVEAIEVDGVTYYRTSSLFFNALGADETVIFVPHSVPIQLDLHTYERLRSVLLETHLGDLIGSPSERDETRYTGLMCDAYWAVTRDCFGRY